MAFYLFLTMGIFQRPYIWDLNVVKSNPIVTEKKTAFFGIKFRTCLRSLKEKIFIF